VSCREWCIEKTRTRRNRLVFLRIRAADEKPENCDVVVAQKSPTAEKVGMLGLVVGVGTEMIHLV
jgi:hypothetical protein